MWKKLRSIYKECEINLHHTDPTYLPVQCILLFKYTKWGSSEKVRIFITTPLYTFIYSRLLKWEKRVKNRNPTEPFTSSLVLVFWGRGIISCISMVSCQKEMTYHCPVPILWQSEQLWRLPSQYWCYVWDHRITVLPSDDAPISLSVFCNNNFIHMTWVAFLSSSK